MHIPRISYSFACLLIFVALVACVLGTWRACVAPFERQDRAIRRLRMAGITISTEARERNWMTKLVGSDAYVQVTCVAVREGVRHYPSCQLDLHALIDVPEAYVSGGGDVFTAFKGMRSIRKLELRGSESRNGKGLAPLAGLPTLEDLDFCLCTVEKADEGVEFIAACSGLRRLAMGGSDISDDGLRRLGNLRRLEVLLLPYSTQIGDDGISMLRYTPLIQQLDLRFSNVADAGCAHIATLDDLRDLDLSGTLVGDDGVAHLVRLPKMRRLNLSGTNITDRSLELLRGCRSLVLLEVRPKTAFVNADVSRDEVPTLSESAVMAFENDRPDVIVFSKWE